MVRERVVHEVAATKPGGVQRAGEPPVVGASTFRLVDRAGRREDVRRRIAVGPVVCRGKAAERTRRFLHLEQLGLARHG
jgi:hypothetical protein